MKKCKSFCLDGNCLLRTPTNVEIEIRLDEEQKCIRVFDGWREERLGISGLATHPTDGKVGWVEEQRNVNFEDKKLLRNPTNVEIENWLDEEQKCIRAFDEWREVRLDISGLATHLQMEKVGWRSKET